MIQKNVFSINLIFYSVIMETLKELRAKYKQLKKESDDIYNQIKILEKKEILSNFTVGDCYFDIVWNTLVKIVAVSNSYVYYICVDEDYIGRDSSYIYMILQVG